MFLLLLFSLSDLCHDESVQIIGGDLAADGAWPWQTAISWTSKADGLSYFCGGTLLTRRYVLTAAHCAADMHPSKSTVRLGSSKPSSGGSTYKISSVYVHPQYSNSKNSDYSNDIAILKVSSPSIPNPSVVLISQIVEASPADLSLWRERDVQLQLHLCHWMGCLHKYFFCLL